MGLAASDMPTAGDGYKIAYYAPQPRAVIQVVDFDDYNKVVDYGQEGRVMLTTLTKELFIPRFLERDEGGAREAERPLSLGRHQRRQALPRVRGDDGGRGVLMKVREIRKLIRRDGWFLVRQNGSHRQFHHPTKAGTVTVAGKPGKTFHPKVVTSIMRQAARGLKTCATWSRFIGIRATTAPWFRTCRAASLRPIPLRKSEI